MHGSATLFELLLRFVATGGALASAGAVYTAMRNNSRQLSQQLFLTYSERLQHIRRSMREDLSTTKPASDRTARAADITPEAIETLHLIFEIYELKRQGFVHRSIWAVWSRDIDRFLRAAAIQGAHDVIKREFYGHPHFIDWLEGRQRMTSGEQANSIGHVALN